MGDLPTIHRQQENSRRNPDFLVLDVDVLSLPPIKTTTNTYNEEMDPFTDSRLHLQRSLSRKGGQRIEWKTPSDGAKELSLSTGTAVEKSSISLASASGQDGPKTGTGTANSNSTPNTTPQSWHKRRLGPSSTTWLNPRKVMLFFATVSSMGTIILLYLTLSR